MRKILFFVVGLAILTTPFAYAATFDAGEYVEHKGTSVQDDLYLAGGSVDISGDIIGDSVTAGGEVSIQGSITGDVLVAGGTVDVLGNVTDDVRAAGGEILIAGNIRDDVVAAGGYVRFLGDATVGGDVVIAAGSVVTNGTIAGDLSVYGGEVIINGVINGDVDLRFTELVTLGDDVTIGGNLTYSALKEIEIPDTALIGGEVIRIETPITSVKKKDFKKFAHTFAVAKVIMSLILALILVLLFKKFSQSFGEDGHAHFWKNTLVGFIAMVVTPILALLLVITFAGALTGGLLFLVGTTLLFIGKAYTGVLGGALLSKWIKKEVIVNWKWTILGVLVIHLLLLVPFIGKLAVFVTFLASFGTILMLAYNKMWKKR